MKIKKYFVSSISYFGLSLVILSNFLFLGSSNAYAAAATLSLSPASGTFNKGCTFSLEIKLDTGSAQTDGTDAILFYDQSRLSATAIRSGTIYSDYPGNNIDAQTGKITVSGLSSVSTAFSGSGTLATVDFTVLDTAPTGATQIRFDFDPNDKAKTTDSNIVERTTVADVLNQVTNGNYTVGTGACGSGSSLTPTPGGGKGGTETITATRTPSPTPSQLSTSGSVETTTILALVGGFLTILGILGLALL